jgi:hypothetical protein
MDKDPDYYEHLVEQERERFREMDAEIEPSLIKPVITFTVSVCVGIVLTMAAFEWAIGP